MSGITIPPIADFRTHIIFVCLYVKMYNILTEEGKIPGYSFEPVVTDKGLVSITNFLTKANPKKPVKISNTDFITIYACYHLSIKILVSRYDETVFDYLLKDLPEHKSWGEFSVARKTIISTNMYLIRDTDNKFPNSPDLARLRQDLSRLIVE